MPAHKRTRKNEAKHGRPSSHKKRGGRGGRGGKDGDENDVKPSSKADAKELPNQQHQQKQHHHHHQEDATLAARTTPIKAAAHQAVQGKKSEHVNRPLSVILPACHATNITLPPTPYTCEYDVEIMVEFFNSSSSDPIDLAMTLRVNNKAEARSVQHIDANSPLTVCLRSKHNLTVDSVVSLTWRPFSRRHSRLPSWISVARGVATLMPTDPRLAHHHMLPNDPTRQPPHPNHQQTPYAAQTLAHVASLPPAHAGQHAPSLLLPASSVPPPNGMASVVVQPAAQIKTPSHHANRRQELASHASQASARATIPMNGPDDVRQSNDVAPREPQSPPRHLRRHHHGHHGKDKTASAEQGRHGRRHKERRGSSRDPHEPVDQLVQRTPPLAPPAAAAAAALDETNRGARDAKPAVSSGSQRQKRRSERDKDGQSRHRREGSGGHRFKHTSRGSHHRSDRHSADEDDDKGDDEPTLLLAHTNDTILPMPSIPGAPAMRSGASMPVAHHAPFRHPAHERGAFVDRSASPPLPHAPSQRMLVPITSLPGRNVIQSAGGNRHGHANRPS